jgi:hypothetical protein
LSYSKVRAITRVATADIEQDIVDIAMHATASQLERLLRSYGRCLDVATGGEGKAQALRGQRRHVHRSETVDGMVRIEIVLPPEEAAIVWDAIEAAVEQRGFASGSVDAEGQASAEASAEADTQADMQAAAQAHTQTGRVPECSIAQQRADAIVDVARAYLQHRPRTLGSAYELVVVTTQAQLESGPAGVGGFLRDGTPIPLHVARMLANDGARVDVVVGEHGELLDVGRKTRAIPAAISRALWLRDGGCRVPGCERSRHLHAHHIHGWAAGGSTSLDNLVLVCSSHHRMIHEGTLAVKLEDSPRDLVGAGPKGAAEGRVVFLDQRGHTIPRFPATAANLAELEHYLHEADLHIDPSLTTPKWDGRPMDLQDSLSWMLMSGDKRHRGSVENESND